MCYDFSDVGQTKEATKVQRKKPLIAFKPIRLLHMVVQITMLYIISEFYTLRLQYCWMVRYFRRINYQMFLYYGLTHHCHILTSAKTSIASYKTLTQYFANTTLYLFQILQYNIRGFLLYNIAMCKQNCMQYCYLICSWRIEGV